MKTKVTRLITALKKQQDVIIFLGLLLFALASRHTVKEGSVPNKNKLEITDNTTSQVINSQVLYSTNFDTTLSKKLGILAYIYTTFKQNKNDELVYFGGSYNYPKAWVYFEVINKTALEKELIIETIHYRCDKLKGFTLKNNNLIAISEIQRETPLSDRFLPYFGFALPFKIQAKDTLRIMLQSERITGIHEVNLSISDKKQYIQKAINHAYLTLFQGVLFIVMMLVLFVIGGLFKHKTMFWLGLYIFFISFGFLATEGVLDTFPFSEKYALQAPNITAFIIFLTHAFFHPFGYQVIKHYLPNKHAYLLCVGIVMGANILIALCHFMPRNQYHNLNYLFTHFFWIFMLINTIWIIGLAVWAYIKANIVWLLSVVIVLLIPTFFTVFLQIIQGQNTETWIKINNYKPYVIVVFLFYMTIKQFTNELTSKQKVQENMDNLKNSLEEQRKIEIEHIGRDLHDQVGNTLASALGYLNMKTIKVETVKSLLINAITELRFISHNLVKDDDRPLSEKVETLVSRFNDFSEVEFHFQDYSNGKLDKISALKQQSIYSIIQELLTNIIKHSKATEVHIQCFEQVGILRVSIEDDGIGLAINNTNGIGLQNIHKRASLTELKLEIDTTTDGTSITIETT